MNNRIRNFIFFAIVIAFLVVTLKVMNSLPKAIQPDSMRRYQSIEQVRSRLNIKDVYVPSYFPQGLIWPPSEILAQNKPFTAVIMEFKNAEKKDTALIISQSVSANFKPDEKIRMQRLKEKVGYPLRGRDMILEAGVCSNEEPCSRITWLEGRYTITVTAKSDPPELIKIAESMIH
jgi:hypothetical protein